MRKFSKSKTYRTMINYSIVKRSVNANLIEINQEKSRINQAKKEGKTPQPAVIKAIKQGKDNVDISKPASPSTDGTTEGGGSQTGGSTDNTQGGGSQTEGGTGDGE